MRPLLAPPPPSAPIAQTLPAAAWPADAVEVGGIGSAWGVQGWFHVHPLSAQAAALRAARRWLVLPPQRGARHFDAALQLDGVQCKAHGNALVARARCVDSRDLAAQLRGAHIWVSRADFPAPEPDQYYWVDLIGCSVSNHQGCALGVVHSLLDSGAQSTLVLHHNAPDGSVRERLIPFVSAIVDNVDIAAKRITAHWHAHWDEDH